MYTLEMARAHLQELQELAERSRQTQPRSAAARVRRFGRRRRTGR